MITKTLGQYLKELRKANSFSQGSVACHLGIARQTYSHYETGRVRPPVNALYKLSRLYDIPIENLLDLVIRDFTLVSSSVRPQDDDDTERYLDYIKDPANSLKIQYLDEQEKLLLYYYSNLDNKDQKDVLTFMHFKQENHNDQ